MTTLTTTREDHTIAWLAALAVTIHIAESALPMVLPGIKPGLANIVTVAALIRFGWRIAAWVAVLRVVAASLLIGTFLSPTFALSVTGTAAGLLVLAAAVRLPGRGFGPVGYSVLGAVAHMGGQFALAYTLFVPHPALLGLLPVLLSAAVVLGLVNGIIVLALLRYPGLHGRTGAPPDPSL